MLLITLSKILLLYLALGMGSALKRFLPTFAARITICVASFKKSNSFSLHFSSVRSTYLSSHSSIPLISIQLWFMFLLDNSSLNPLPRKPFPPRSNMFLSFSIDVII